jgi:threonyl-tRNA synthetase
VRARLRREWQPGTVQLEYNLPERFKPDYVGSDNQRHRPIMIHRAPFGSFERFVGILIEHYAGNFPLWLAPEQVRVLPLGEDQLPAARALLEALLQSRVRATLDTTGDKIGGKIRKAEVDKVHTMLIVGPKELEAGTVAVRIHGRGDQGARPRDEVLSQLTADIQSRRLCAAGRCPLFGRRVSFVCGFPGRQERAPGPARGNLRGGIPGSFQGICKYLSHATPGMGQAFQVWQRAC